MASHPAASARQARKNLDTRKIAAVSQCQPLGARKIVPCFDEPHYKAIWNVTIIHPKGTTAIANALELNETTEPNGEWKVSRFHPTPLLSSYLLALFVSEFEYDEAYTKRGVRFRMWSSPNTKDGRPYGLKTAIIFMEKFEEYFGVQDIVMKQDLVAVSKHLGGMENWGLITLKDGIVLTNGLLPSPETIDTAAVTLIAHELAHQAHVSICERFPMTGQRGMKFSMKRKRGHREAVNACD
ncbi:hypothetical protein Y032_0012g1914 [Ancylostoma ceylanicum]|uniref:Uncharacterized protein n=2 Tax=Ancylostoma ceylanicum TaxID=53326 RepID=A0A016VDH3_9BILA|nr:hypothetical protein Y032_0012g1914 [Ancylostoma ceylanicum]